MVIKKKKQRGIGRRFQKGEIHNPGGRPKRDPIIRQFQETKYKDFIDKLQMFGSMSKGELEDIVHDDETVAFDQVFARVLYDSTEGKDKARDTLFERLWGKAKESEVTAQFSAEHELMRRIPIAELIELARKYIKSES